MINIIAATSKNGVVGLGSQNKLPFHYPEDLKHFKEKTLNSTIIMGRKTFESIGRPLPKRKNIVITSTSINVENVITFPNLSSAIGDEIISSKKDIWLIGGTNIWREGLEFTDEIHLTITSDSIKDSNPIFFPWINPLKFELSSVKKSYVESSSSILNYCIYSKI